MRLQKIYEAARRRIEKAESEIDVTDERAWDAFWEREVTIQRKSLERALPTHRMPWND